MIQAHPSVLKYMKDERIKKLIDPIKEEEMDHFIEFCNHQLNAKLNDKLSQIRMMYNPLTNDEEIIPKAVQNKGEKEGYDTDGDEKSVYDPEAIKK